ncbi:MAG TPA: hypothetical protein VF720_10570 [Candidatus Eisenbacteria bacterium]
MIVRAALASLVALACWSGPARTPSGHHDDRIRGVALAEIHPGRPLSAYRHALDDIRSLGADWVLLPVFGYVDSASSPGIDTDWERGYSMATYRRRVAEVVREADERDLAVALVPYLLLRTGQEQDWRGTLAPDDWPAWFRSYRAFLDGWISLAVSARVPLLAVGAELASSEAREAEWRSLIAHVRSRYQGRLFYSCNWDHYEETTFLDALDVVGVSGYFSPDHDVTATDAALDAMWMEVRRAMLTWQERMDRPFFFTEVGCPSIKGAASHPWNYQAPGPADPAEQARALAAFCRAWHDRPEPEGVFYWNWSPFRGGISDRSYSIRRKPAADIVRGCLARPATPAPAP